VINQIHIQKLDVLVRVTTVKKHFSPVKIEKKRMDLNEFSAKMKKFAVF